MSKLHLIHQGNEFQLERRQINGRKLNRKTVSLEMELLSLKVADYMLHDSAASNTRNTMTGTG